VTSKPDFKVMVLLLVFMQLTRDLFAIAKFLLFFCYPFSTTIIFLFNIIKLLCPAPIGEGYYKMSGGVCPSVRMSVYLSRAST